MSKATKRKHVVKEILNEFVLPTENQEIVRILNSRGNNLHEIENSQGEKFLVSMPTKFRKNIWIKRGDYVVIEPIEEGDKVKAEIIHILYKEQIRHIKQENRWPKEFTEEEIKTVHSEDENFPSQYINNSAKYISDSECEDDIFVNTNRVKVIESNEESSESSEELESEN